MQEEEEDKEEEEKKTRHATRNQISSNLTERDLENNPRAFINHSILQILPKNQNPFQ